MVPQEPRGHCPRQVVGIGGKGRISLTECISDTKHQMPDQWIRIPEPRDQLDLGGITPHEITGHFLNDETAQIDVEGVECAIEANAKIDTARHHEHAAGRYDPALARSAKVRFTRTGPLRCRMVRWSRTAPNES